MKIDYLSDLHFDNYFRANDFNVETIVAFLKSIFKDKKSDILIIAGDFGHHNEQIISVVKLIRKYFYKHIVSVLGNHDYYLINDEISDRYKANSFERVRELRENLNIIDGVHCLDGNIVEIEGVRFGGCDSWYDGSYLMSLFPRRDFSYYSINEMWKNSLNDYRYIFGVERYNEIFEIEFPKIEKVYKECDVMITHVNPSIKIEHTQKKYSRSQTTAFFAFDAEEFMKKGDIKYWIYGHTHEKNEYEFADVKVLCNPMGYPHENLHFKLESFEI